MTGNEFAAALPFPLVLASIGTCIAAIAAHSRQRYGWSDLLCAVAMFLLAASVLIAWCTA